MNIIKKVIVIVMGIVTIGVLSTAIGISTQTKTVEKSVTFELLENDKLANNVFEKINEYAIYNDIGEVTNLISISVNGDYNIFGVEPYAYTSNNNTEFIISDTDDEVQLGIIINNEYYTSGLNIGDIISITFEVEIETPAIVKTLLALTPLILTATVIMFAYKGFGNKE